MTYEQAPRPTDEQLIDQGIEWAAQNRLPIPDSTARRIALAWHGGQASAFYSFGSTGAIDFEPLQAELRQACAECQVSPEGEADLGRLAFLGEYFETADERGPVEGWHRLTDDGRPAVMYIEQLRPEQYIGSYENRRELALDLLRSTGLLTYLTSMEHLLGANVMRYVNLNLDLYEADMTDNVRVADSPEGGIDAYWRL